MTRYRRIERTRVVNAAGQVVREETVFYPAERARRMSWMLVMAIASWAIVVLACVAALVVSIARAG